MTFLILSSTVTLNKKQTTHKKSVLMAASNMQCLLFSPMSKVAGPLS